MNYSLFTEFDALGTESKSAFSREDFEEFQAIANYRGGGKTERIMGIENPNEKIGLSKTWGKESQNRMTIKPRRIIIELKNEEGTKYYSFLKRKEENIGWMEFRDEKFGGIYLIKYHQSEPNKGNLHLSYYDEEAINYVLEQKPDFSFTELGFADYGIEPDIEETETIKDGNFVEVLGKISVGKLRKKVEEAYQSQPKKL